jgi:hypothetical protein
MRSFAATLLGSIMVLFFSGIARAQTGPGPGRFAVSLAPGGELSPTQTDARSIRPSAAFFASAIVPGAGQFLQEEDRWVPYVVAEGWAWITYFTHRSRQRDFKQQYRDLAWAVARRVSVGSRRDTVFEYYETLSDARWQNSGAFDADPRTPGIQPEPDLTTFNGDVWRLSRAINIPGGGTPIPGRPEYERALQYYVNHAIPPAYAWAWGPFGLEQQRFRELIRESDDAARAATLRLGIILANHLISAIDALIIGRLRDDTGGDGGLSVHLTSHIDTTSPDTRWVAGVRVMR